MTHNENRSRVEHVRLSDFLERFYHFCDTIIDSIQLTFSEHASRELQIILQARDDACQVNESWARVALHLEEVSELKLFDQCQRGSLHVISDGIHILSQAENLGLEFGGALETPATLEELRTSPAYAIGKTFAFEVLQW